jgi:uncharacterized membrane protein
MNKSRFEAFSDSVFAFAITLLVLGIALPESHYTSNRDLSAALIRLWPNGVAYGLSFAVIGIMWQNHHALFRLVERIERRTVLLNLLLLAGTAFIPFATMTLGSYPVMRASTFLYVAVLSFWATANNLMLEHLLRGRAFYSGVSGVAVAPTVRAYRLTWGTELDQHHRTRPEAKPGLNLARFRGEFLVSLARWRLPNLDRVALRVMHPRKAAGFRRVPAWIGQHLNARAPQIGEQRIQVIHSQIDHELLVGGEIIRIGGKWHEHRGPCLLVPDCLAGGGEAEMGAVPRCQRLWIACPEEKPANAGYCHASFFLA